MYRWLVLALWVCVAVLAMLTNSVIEIHPNGLPVIPYQ